MRWLKRLGVIVLTLPVALFVLWGLYEVLGLCVNHIAAKGQTDTLRRNLEQEISDLEIVSVFSETGNMSGTGNHVECLSSVTFSTELEETEIKDRMSDHYVLDGWSGDVKRTEDGYFVISIVTSAPFMDNIEGH